ncbi:hypothetical protein TUM20985_42970 [Mycobacterium antarcticum]|nr:hypothetical protein TUM20985_42970 [Mycolicibacterium sp. TUM20985]
MPGNALCDALRGPRNPASATQPVNANPSAAMALRNAADVTTVLIHCGTRRPTESARNRGVRQAKTSMTNEMLSAHAAATTV